MRSPQDRKRELSPPAPDTALDTALSGWDIGIAAFALACMTAGFWRIWPGAVSLEDTPVGPMMLKAGLAALGFVAVATRWEDTVKALARNPLILVMMALVCSSAIWAIVPTDVLRSAILLIVVWCFGMALTLRFRARELAEICAFAGLFGLLAQFAAHKSMPPLSAFDGDIAFAIIGTAWAAWCVPARRALWLLVGAVCCALALAAGDWASFGGVLGLCVGIGVAQVSAIKGRQGAVSVIVTAWVLVALIISVTLFALFGADPVGTRISGFFSGLGTNIVLGQGFGLAGQSITNSLGAGLGIVGVALAALVALGSLFQALLNGPSLNGDRQGAGDNGAIAILSASLGAIVSSPSEITIFGPVCILFAAASFSISLSGITTVRRRRTLTAASVSPSRVEVTPRLARKTSIRPKPSLSLGLTPLSVHPLRNEPSSIGITEMGLRPKR